MKLVSHIIDRSKKSRDDIFRYEKKSLYQFDKIKITKRKIRNRILIIGIIEKFASYANLLFEVLSEFGCHKKHKIVYCRKRGIEE